MDKLSKPGLKELTLLESRLKRNLWGMVIVGIVMIFIVLYLRTVNPLVYLSFSILPIVIGPLVFWLRSVQAQITEHKNG